MANETNGPISAAVNEYLGRMKAFHDETGFYRFDGLTTTIARVTQAGRVDLIDLELDVVNDTSLRNWRSTNGVRTISLNLRLKNLPDTLSYLTAIVEATSKGDRGSQTGYMGVPEDANTYFERLQSVEERLKDVHTDKVHNLYTGSLEDISKELAEGGCHFTHIFSENPNESIGGSENTIVLINDRPGEDISFKRGKEEKFRYQLRHTFASIPRGVAYCASVVDKEVFGF